MAGRLIFVAAVLQLASGISKLHTDSKAPATKKAIVATVFEHTRAAPVDLMLAHQVRMLSSSHANVAQVAIINAKVPGVDRQGGTAHDPILAQLQRSYGTTSRVQVVDLEKKLANQVSMFQKVFSLKDGSTASFARSFFKQELTSEHMKRQMAYFQGMLHFFDLCASADDHVELCVAMEAESLLFRKDKKGLLELASELFDDDDQVMALQPPTYCDYMQANHRPSWAKKERWTNSSFVKCVANATKARAETGPANLVFNRQRLMAALPLTINKADLEIEKGFDLAFMAGMLSHGVPVKGMQCGHTFLVRQSTDQAKCKGRKVTLSHQLRVAGKAEHGGQADFVAGEYALFDQTLVRGLETILARLERGQIPPAMGTVGNKCQEMCPSAERISKEALAW